MDKSRRARPGIRALAAACVCLLWVIPSRAQNLERTRLGISDLSFTYLPHLIAKDTGIFRKHGLEIELIYVGGPVAISAMSAGELDYTAATDTGLTAAVQGVSFKAVMFTTKSPLFYLISQPGMRKISDLVGKKVGVSRVGSSPYYIGRAIFRKFGVDPDKITYIQAGSNMNRVVALTNGSLDGSMLSLPTARIMIENGFTELASPRDIGFLPHAGLMARTVTIEKNREQVKKMIASLVDAMEHIAKNKVKVVEYISAKWNLSRELAEQLLVKDFTPMLTMDGRMAPQAVQEYLDSAYQNKLISRQAKASEVLDLSMLEEVWSKR